jgi:hypothetical protein
MKVSQLINNLQDPILQVDIAAMCNMSTALETTSFIVVPWYAIE